MHSAASAGIIFDIRRYSVHDGPGIRTAVFFKGCPARCAWCHNPESQASMPELMHWPAKCAGCGLCMAACPTGAIAMANGYGTEGAALRLQPRVRSDVCDACGACVAACPNRALTVVGRAASADEIMAEIERDRLFYDQSGGGATFTGGEPLSQPELLLELVNRCADVDIHTCVDTSGIAAASVVGALAPRVGLWLYDVKSTHSTAHRSSVGVSTELPLSNLRMLAGLGARVFVRVPLIPTFNDTEKHMRDIAAALQKLGGRRVERVHVLPYHTLGVEKYARLGCEYTLPQVRELDGGRVAALAAAFRDAGFDTRIGG